MQKRTGNFYDHDGQLKPGSWWCIFCGSPHIMTFDHQEYFPVCDTCFLDTTVADLELCLGDFMNKELVT